MQLQITFTDNQMDCSQGIPNDSIKQRYRQCVTICLTGMIHTLGIYMVHIIWRKFFRPRIRKRNVKSKKQKNSSSTYINNLNISENYVQNGRFSSHLNGELKGCMFQIDKKSMLMTDFGDLNF